ncbi:hypothetical protein [Streptomyces sp. Tu 3180]|uniref:hypothetical protein n=1 Tax=Streptomyces sp. Tu 3180 TaxID=2682611 RepID=UPI00135AC189|nr:hypothetical protein [Streptomyces sp. Tu 3180]KAF3465952.1 hypothetical protein GL259_17515 [Streptomyces sp. Tu 3180]
MAGTPWFVVEDPREDDEGPWDFDTAGSAFIAALRDPGRLPVRAGEACDQLFNRRFTPWWRSGLVGGRENTLAARC